MGRVCAAGRVVDAAWIAIDVRVGVVGAREIGRARGVDGVCAIGGAVGSVAAPIWAARVCIVAV